MEYPVINGEKVTHGIQVKTNAVRQTLYFVFWQDLVEYMSRHICYDYEIKNKVPIPENAKEVKPLMYAVE